MKTANVELVAYSFTKSESIGLANMWTANLDLALLYPVISTKCLGSD
ncbi:MAG: hypothetical protein LBN29_03980 [Mediterranea sp.]|jgi:hypothetical protein|nr:hypothetical protein [Mediterranea sp.]